MANQEHLDVIKQGRNVWNRWKELQPFGSNADLSETNLKGTILLGTNLTNAIFRS